MEQNFQTSFIPKKPIIAERAVASKPVSFLAIISIFIFISTVLVAGGLYFYKTVLAGQVTSMNSDLEKEKNRFDPSKIAQLQVLDKRLQASSEVLSNHIAISPIFKTLQSITMKTIRYTKFSYKLGTEKNLTINVDMSGQATSYRDIALQADLFTQNKNLIEPVFSNLSLNDKGGVIFNLKFSVDPSFVDYKQALMSESDNSSFGADQSGVTN